MTPRAVQKKPRTRSEEQRHADDAALLATGEPLGTVREIATLLQVSPRVVRWLKSRWSPWVSPAPPMVRYLSSSSPTLLCVADVRAALDEARPMLDARRSVADERQAHELAAAATRRETKTRRPTARQRPTATAVPSTAAGSKLSRCPRPLAAPAARSNVGGPEVVVMRRRA